MHPLELSPELYGFGQYISTYRGQQVAYHYGVLSGHHSLVLRLPGRDLGVAALTNGGYENFAVAETIARAIVDKVLGSEPIAWEKRLARRMRRNEAGFAYTPPPARPSPPRGSIAGRYESPGYGILDVVPFDPTSEAHAIWTRDLPPTIRAASANSTWMGTLRDSLLLPVIVFTHFDGILFNYTAPVHAPSADGGSTAQLTPFPFSPGQAVIDADGGRVGLGSNFVQLHPTYKYEGADTTGREGDDTGVDVWFVKTSRAGV